MPGPELIRAFLSQATATGGRSTALQPLGWLAGILTVGLVLAPSWNPPKWLLVLMGVLLSLSVALYLASYIYFVVRNPDALRSERFTLSKMAMEKNLIGDSKAGLIGIDEMQPPNRPVALPSPKEGGRE